jgi:hypothetical protein
MTAPLRGGTVKRYVKTIDGKRFASWGYSISVNGQQTGARLIG